MPNMLDHVSGLAGTEAVWLGAAEWMSESLGIRKFQVPWCPGRTQIKQQSLICISSEQSLKAVRARRHLLQSPLSSKSPPYLSVPGAMAGIGRKD